MSEGLTENRVIGWFKGFLGTRNQALPAEQHSGYLGGKTTKKVATKVAQVGLAVTTALGAGTPIASEGIAKTVANINNRVETISNQPGIDEQVNTATARQDASSRFREESRRNTPQNSTSPHLPQNQATMEAINQPPPTPEPSSAKPLWERPAVTPAPGTTPDSFDETVRQEMNRRLNR